MKNLRTATQSTPIAHAAPRPFGALATSLRPADARCTSTAKIPTTMRATTDYSFWTDKHVVANDHSQRACRT